MVGTRVLIVLVQNRIVPCDQKSGRRVTAKIALDREPIRSEIVKDRWLRCPLEQPRRRRAFYEARRKQFIEMAVSTHEVSNLAGRRSRANRKAYRCAVSCCIGAGTRKHRPRRSLATIAPCRRRVLGVRR
jgi:hypothetical protein